MIEKLRRSVVKTVRMFSRSARWTRAASAGLDFSILVATHDGGDGGQVVCIKREESEQHAAVKGGEEMVQAGRSGAKEPGSLGNDRPAGEQRRGQGRHGGGAVFMVLVVLGEEGDHWPGIEENTTIAHSPKPSM